MYEDDGSEDARLCARLHDCVSASSGHYEHEIVQTILEIPSWESELVGWCVSHLETLHEAAGKEARPAGALKRPLVPAVLTFLVHEHDVALLQLDLGLALRRVRDEHTVPDEKRTDVLYNR